MSISVILITLNEEKHITACLESVSWADEIIVVDSKSQDRTVELAKNFTDQIIIKDFIGYAHNKNIALDHASGEWIFWIDADERVTPELAHEIQGVITGADSADAYEVPRRACFLGRWIKHCGWYPGYVLRLFRRDKARFNEKKVHEGVDLQGRVERCKHDLLHYTDDDIEHYLKKLNVYTSLAADELLLKNQKSGIFSILLRPAFAFFKMYILKRGFLDGVQGLMLCMLSASYVLLKYAKLWERHWFSRSKKG